MTRQEILNQLANAAAQDNYRGLQKALGNYKKAGFPVYVKLNAKKYLLKDEAVRILTYWERYQQQYEEWQRNNQEQQEQTKSYYYTKETNHAVEDAWVSLVDRVKQEWLTLNNQGMTYKQILRNLSLKYHPDRGGRTEEMQAVNRAAEIFA